MSDPFSPYQPPSPPSPYPPSAGGYPPAAYPWGQPAGMPPPQPPMPRVARAAAVMAGILGGLILVGSVIIALVLLLMPMSELQAGGALRGVPPEMDPRTFMNIAAGCFGICGGIMGISLLVLTPFIWKGNRGGIIAAIVFAGIAILLILINGVGALFSGAGAEAIVALVMNLVIAAIFATLMFLLIGSLSALRRRDEQLFAAGQQAAWYYQQQYQQQQYQQQQYQQQQAQQEQPPAPPRTGWGEGGEPPQNG